MDRLGMHRNTPQPLLTRSEAAKALAISIRLFDSLVARGEIAVVRIGKSVRIRPSAINYFVEARERHCSNRGR